MNRQMYPLSAEVGYKMWEQVGKDKWLAIAVTLLKEKLGPTATPEDIQAEVASMLDKLHSQKRVPSTLPRRFPRSTESRVDES